MKNAKKVIMIPEDEYLALLSLIKDPLVIEKGKIEGEMHQILRDPKLDENLKMKKHSALFKQRRALKEKIGETPQKVSMETDPNENNPSVPPYLGINTPTRTGQFVPLDETALPSQRVKSEPVPRATKTVKPETLETARKPAKKTRDPPQAYINPNYIDDLIRYVETNKEKFGVTPDGKVKSTARRAIVESNYENVIRYLSTKDNERYNPPNGFFMLFERLKSDPYYQNLYKKSLQEGFGKKMRPLTKVKKVRGLKRVSKKPFRPTIWTRL